MPADVGAPSTPLQFDVAVRAVGTASTTGAGASCTACQSPIRSLYFEANGAIVCPRCRQAADAHGGGTGAGRVARAGLFGLGGAAAGAALYFGVAALTGYEIGLVAIAVGYLVGRGVQLGSGSRGGWRYQAMALLLTQLAVGSAYFAQGMREMGKAAGSAPAAADSAAASAAAATPDNLAPASAPAATRAPEAPAGPLARAGGVAAIAAFIFALPLIAGLSDFPSNAIGLIIVAIALHQAWSLNRGGQVTFTGPYQLGRAEHGGAGAPARG